jgi:hypothetical protein
MEVHEWVDDLKRDCERGGQLRDLGSDIWTRDLLPEEIEILIAVADCGEIALSLAPNSQIPIILAGAEPIFAETNPFSLTQQWYALRSLAMRGVVQHESDARFVFDDASRLKGARLRALRLLNDD